MSSCTTHKAFRTATLIRSEQIAADIVRMDFAWAGAAPQAGQFFIIRPQRTSVFLGRPISVGFWQGPANGGAGIASFFIAIKGQGTRDLAAMQSGEDAELSGPLGNCWLDEDLLETAKADLPKVDPQKPIALIGGGIGIAPLISLAHELHPQSYDFLAGFRSRSWGLKQLHARALILATEDGCEGCQGRIPDLMDPSLYSAVYACGPTPMLRAVAESCAKAKVPCLISMERRMACGTGACLGCTIATTRGNRRCCADGPIFDAREILFDECC